MNEAPFPFQKNNHLNYLREQKKIKYKYNKKIQSTKRGLNEKKRENYEILIFVINLKKREKSVRKLPPKK
jgi:hypothetical protein